MALTAGTRLGSYEILGPLGAGGMGEVYRATDARLGRDVAIKVLPSEVAEDPERLGRFRREAQLLASVNHPHIAAIHGLEESDTGPFLVLELVEGEDLAERLKRGPLPAREALQISRQIGEALEGAHEKGIVHRDLKPANVKVTPDGTVKVLDFGLAKAWEGDTAAGSSRDQSQSPTLAHSGTQAGVILGTAGYMSPEQARGEAVDKRADVWAFGVLLYEMLTGRRAFAGETVSDTLAFVLTRDLDLEALPGDTPASVRRLLRRCLARDRKARLADISVARLEIDDAGVISGSPEPAPAGFWQRPRGLAAVAVVALAVGSAGVWSMARPAPSPRPLMSFGVALPEGRGFTRTGRRQLAAAPDGSFIVYVARGLWTRPLAQLRATRIPGIEDPSDVFVSPDGQWIGFFDEQLKKVAVSGGAPITLCEVRQPWGASWGENDTILFGQGQQGIWRVPARGGPPERVIEVAAGERAHGPQMLPGGEWVLFTLLPEGVLDWDAAQIVVQSLETGVREILIEGGRDARHLPTGHLVYGLHGVLLGVAFDADRRVIVGGPVPLIEGVFGLPVTGAMQFAHASSGMLVYRPGALEDPLARSLARVDRSGQQELLPVTPGPYDGVRVAPDGTRLALGQSTAGQQAVWVADLDRGSATRVALDTNIQRLPIWSPDGQWLVFASDRDGVPALYRKAADGTGSAEPVFSLGGVGAIQPHDWTPDGTAIVATVVGPDGEGHLGLAHLEAPGSWEPLFRSDPARLKQRYGGHLSPDGGWIAYVSNETGQAEVYVQRFPDPGVRRLVSVGGGFTPRWSPDGTQLFYLRSATRAGRPVAMMGVALEREGAALTAGPPEELFEWSFRHTATGDWAYDVAPDGRFLMLASNPQTASADSPESPADMVVVLNWLDELKRRVPTQR